MVKRDITLRLDVEVIRVAEVAAARENTSVGEWLAERVRALVAQDGRYEEAKARALDALERPTARGVVAWTREELYDR